MRYDESLQNYIIELSKKTAFPIELLLFLAIFLLTFFPVTAGEASGDSLDAVVVEDVDSRDLVVTLSDYGIAYPSGDWAEWDHPLWDYLTGDEKAPHLIGLRTRQGAFIDLRSYAANFHGDMSEAIEKATSISDDEVAGYEKFIGFAEDGSAVLEPVVTTEYTLSFTILDKAGNSLEGAEVKLNGKETLVTGTGGQVVFEELPSGNYSYTVYKTGYEQASGEVNLAEDKKEVDITLAAVQDEEQDEPAVSYTEPEDGATGVKNDASIIVVFDQNIVLEDPGKVILKAVESGQLAECSVQVEEENRLRIIPDETMDCGAAYHLALEPGVVVSAEDPEQGLAESFKFEFTIEEASFTPEEKTVTYEDLQLSNVDHYLSSNAPDVATVMDGQDEIIITAVGPGEAAINAQSDPDMEATVEVTVEQDGTLVLTVKPYLEPSVEINGAIEKEHHWPASVLDEMEPLVEPEDKEIYSLKEEEINGFESERTTEEPVIRKAPAIRGVDVKEQHIVAFEAIASEKGKEAVLKTLEAEVVSKCDFLNTYLVEVPIEIADKQIPEIAKDPAVSYIEPNHEVKAHLTIPNDSLFKRQWHYSQIRLPQAWSVETGSSAVRIAVLDTGIDADHPDLGGSVDLVAGYNFVDDNDDIRDLNGHGTLVAGLIAADTDNELGVSGIMWDVELIPVKILGGDQAGNTYNVARGIYYAAGLTEDPGLEEPAQVINLSLGGSSHSRAVEEAVVAARNAGVLVICSSGNYNEDAISYPARYPETIAVGAVDYNYPDQPERAPYSNYGRALDLVAPGGDLSTDSKNDGHPDGVLSTNSGGNEYIFCQGTSFSAPHVTGVVGLMLAAGIEADQIREILHRTSMDLGDNGFDQEYGYGLLNAYWAVNAVNEINILVGERDGNSIDAVAEAQVGLGAQSFTLQDVPAGKYRVYGWIDIRGTGTIDPGDYLAQSKEKVFEAETKYEVDLILKEEIGDGASGAEVTAID